MAATADEHPSKQGRKDGSRTHDMTRRKRGARTLVRASSKIPAEQSSARRSFRLEGGRGPGAPTLLPAAGGRPCLRCYTRGVELRIVGTGGLESLQAPIAQQHPSVCRGGILDNVGGLPVPGHDGSLIAFVAERDIRRAVEQYGEAAGHRLDGFAGYDFVITADSPGSEPLSSRGVAPGQRP
jgi:hypothetical protein